MRIVSIITGKLLPIVFLPSIILGMSDMIYPKVKSDDFPVINKVIGYDIVPEIPVSSRPTLPIHTIKSINPFYSASTYEPPIEEVEIIAKVLWGECRGIPNTMEKAAVVWCITNRLDAGFGDSIIEVITAPNQFAGYDKDYPLDEELMEIARDVLIRWHREKQGEKDVGRVLPPSYLFFVGDGDHNWFSEELGASEYWDWDVIDVYGDYEIKEGN